MANFEDLKQAVWELENQDPGERDHEGTEGALLCWAFEEIERLRNASEEQELAFQFETDGVKFRLRIADGKLWVEPRKGEVIVTPEQDSVHERGGERVEAGQQILMYPGVDYGFGLPKKPEQ